MPAPKPAPEMVKATEPLAAPAKPGGAAVQPVQTLETVAPPAPPVTTLVPTGPPK